MAQTLMNKRVAILATHGFQESELKDPKLALEAEGATTQVVSLDFGEIRGWKDGDWAGSIKVDATLDGCSSEDFDALLIPGGTMSPDMLRMDAAAVQFVKDFMESGKPIGAICHGPWLLVEADCVRDRTVTSWPGIKTDLINAGAEWVDREVVTDQGLVTSRKPQDIPAFSAKLIEEVREGIHARTSTGGSGVVR